MNRLTRIALIEPFDHSEVLYVLCELLLEQKVELWVFCQHYITEDCPETLRMQKNIQWKTFVAKDRKNFFFHQEESLNQCQLLIWITAPPSAYGWINRLRLRVPVVLLIHNLHTWLAPWKHIQLSRSSGTDAIVDFMRLARFILSQRRPQKLLLKKATAIGVPSQNMLSLARKFSDQGGIPQTIFVPFSYFTKITYSQNDTKTINIVIPGVVSENGRDYQLVTNAFRQALPFIKSPINLILLGKARDRHIVHTLKALELESDQFKITCFSERIPQKTYVDYLEKAHFMILPFSAFQKFGVVREKWGLSKISGGVSDLIRYRIPTICSEHYIMDSRTENLVETYDSQERLSRLLIHWIEQKDYLRYRFFPEFLTKNVLSDQLYQSLTDLINTD